MLHSSFFSLFDPLSNPLWPTAHLTLCLSPSSSFFFFLSSPLSVPVLHPGSPFLSLPCLSSVFFPQSVSSFSMYPFSIFLSSVLFFFLIFSCTTIFYASVLYSGALCLSSFFVSFSVSLSFFSIPILHLDSPLTLFSICLFLYIHSYSILTPLSLVSLSSMFLFSFLAPLCPFCLSFDSFF